MGSGEPFDLPYDVAREFVAAMRDYFTQEDPTSTARIAAHRLRILKNNQTPATCHCICREADEEQS